MGKTSDNQDLSGIWHSHYKYSSSGRKGEYEGEHYVKLFQDGNRLVLESLPNPDKSYLVVRLTLDDNIATGNWQEHTEPEGYYQGAIYHGAIQLLLSPDGQKMSGKWLGHDKENNINTGPWDFTFIGKRLKDIKA